MSLSPKEEQLIESIEQKGYNEVSAHRLPDGGILVELSHRASMDDAVILRIRDDSDIAFLYGSVNERHTNARTNTGGPWEEKNAGWHWNPEFPNHVEGCICPRFKDIAPQLIADLTCPVHGVNGTNPGDIVE